MVETKRRTVVKRGALAGLGICTLAGTARAARPARLHLTVDVPPKGVRGGQLVTVGGTVDDGQGKSGFPVAGASLTGRLQRSSNTARSDKTGRATLLLGAPDVLNTFTGTVRASKSGYIAAVERFSITVDRT